MEETWWPTTRTICLAPASPVTMLPRLMMLHSSKYREKVKIHVSRRFRKGLGAHFFRKGLGARFFRKGLGAPFFRKGLGAPFFRKGLGAPILVLLASSFIK
jgi:hypothetical protein